VKGELENLFRQAPVGIAVFEDPDHVVLLANPTLQRIPWGGQRDDLVGTPFPRVMPEPPGRLRPEARDGVYRTGAAYVRNEAPWVLRNADGSPRTAYLNYVVDARRDGADNVVGTVVEVHDVTEQAQGWQRTEAALHARDSFLSIASHERRTPVTGMLLRNENVRRDFPRKKAGVLSEDNVLRWLEQTDHGLRRMDRLVADMLDASRWQLDETVLERTETDVVALLRGVAEAFAPELEAAKIAVSLLGPPSLRLSVDELRLEQVFSNLFTKAIRYAPGAPLAVSIVEDTRYVRFTFRDGGPGISRSDRERIFRRFERLVPADDISGLGLGLYIVRELVEAHGGTVRVESEPGDEAAFCVELPRVGPEGAAHGAAGRQRE
jgi:signal transduction histidine kinase